MAFRPADRQLKSTAATHSIRSRVADIETRKDEIRQTSTLARLPKIIWKQAASPHLVADSLIVAAHNQGHRSLWDRGTCPPIFIKGDIHGNVPTNILEVMSFTMTT